MPAPGVYVNLEDQSFYLNLRKDTKGAMQLVTERGPLTDPVLVYTWAGFVEKFGGVPDDEYAAHGVRAAKRALDRGVPLRISRVVHYTDLDTRATVAKASAAALPARFTDYPAGAPDTLDLAASSEGTWGDGLSVQILDGYLGLEFRITVSLDGVVVETLDRLSMDQASSRFVGTVLLTSKYIRGEALFPNGGSLDTWRPAVGTYTLGGGNDGLAGLTETDFVGTDTGRTGLYAFAGVKDVRMLAAPGLLEHSRRVGAGGFNEGFDWIDAALLLAAARKSLTVVIGMPMTDGGGDADYDAVGWRVGYGGYVHGSWDTMYSAFYYGWPKASVPGGTREYVPPEGDVFAAYAYTDQRWFPWFAPAGAQRGRIQDAVGVHVELLPAEVSVLYEAGINPVIKDQAYGVTLWGQRNGQIAASAFDRLNVSRATIEHALAMATVGARYVMEPHDATTWRAVVRDSEPYWDEVKRQRGVIDYRIICDESNNPPAEQEAHRLHVQVFVKFTPAAEWVYVDIIATPLGATFETGSEEPPEAGTSAASTEDTGE